MTALRVSEEFTHGDHVCAFVDSPSDRHRILTGFVRAGLESGDRVWHITDREPAGVVLGRLRAQGLRVDAAVARGQLSVRPADDAYLQDLPFDPERMVTSLHHAVDDALDAGFTGFRVCGDMAWATRGVPGAERLLEYESRVGEVFATRPAAAICQYDRARFDHTTVTATVGLHTHELLTDPVRTVLHISPMPDAAGLRLDGEADLETRDQLRAALAELAGDTVRVQMGGLRFIDVGSLDEIMAAARPPRRLMLHEPPAIVLRMIAVLWPDSDVEVRHA